MSLDEVERAVIAVHRALGTFSEEVLQAYEEKGELYQRAKAELEAEEGT